MRELVLLGMLLALMHTGAAVRCYDCSYTKSVADGVELGDIECADPSFNIAQDDGTRVKDACAACTKSFTFIDTERYEVVRGCLANFDSPTAYDRLQKFNTCGVVPLNGGNYTNCVCDGDFCNFKTDCDSKFGCWETCPSCPSPPNC